MKRYVITGTSRGVGRALALAAGEKGAHVMGVGRLSPEQEKTAFLMKEAGFSFDFFPTELTDPESISESTEQINQGGAVDVIVHNAGVIERAAVHQMSDATWQKQMAVNLFAPFAITRQLLPLMLAKARGRILFVSSISAVLGAKQQSAYHASKAGVVGLMRCLAEELSDSGLMTMALLPGAIDTDMLQGSGFPPRMTAEEVAATLLFYAEDASQAHQGAAVEMFGV